MAIRTLKRDLMQDRKECANEKCKFGVAPQRKLRGIFLLKFE